MTERNDLINQIYHQYKDLMFAVAFSILNDKYYAEDALQISIEKILKSYNLFADLESVQMRRFIVSVTRNTAIDIYRKRNANWEREVSWEDVIDIPSVEMTVPYEDESFIALNQLPKIYKEIIDLKYSYGYKLSEIADVLNITEANEKKRVSRARIQLTKTLKKCGLLILCIVGIALTGMAVNAATGGRLFAAFRELFGAEVISEENIDLIGNEVISNTIEIYDSDEIMNGVVIPEPTGFANSKLINSVTEDILIPLSTSDIKTTNGMCPEILIDVNACAVLYENNYSGWYCEPGDILTFEFSKYEMDNGRSQKISIGYVLNGVMYEGERYTSQNGCYQLYIQEEGEYYIYLFNLDSDYLTIKSGSVSIN